MINLQKKLIDRATKNEIYTKAKAFYVENCAYKSGMCLACIHVLKEYGVEIKKNNFSDLYDFLPEMLEVKPKNNRGYFWWEANQIKRRLNAFDTMIKLTM
jgi:hypothetical protein